MIQFNRYRLPDETHDFHSGFLGLVNAIDAEVNGDCNRSIGMLLSMAERFPLNERLPAVAVRLFFWGKISWAAISKMMPSELPRNFFYKQELVGCLGFEQSARKWGITEDQWRLYQGLEDWFPTAKKSGDIVSYRPRSSGFFSIIENVVAAHIIAELRGKQAVIDLSGGWWGYDEPFEDIFGDVFAYTKDGTLPQISFDGMRHVWLNANDEMASTLSRMKAAWYNDIWQRISKYVPQQINVDSAGVMFVRGGDKLQTETIMPPVGLIHRELKWMARRCDQRYILSDDKRIGEIVSSYDAFTINRSTQVEGGYHHIPGRKVSCINLLGNYLMMIEAKENMSCPSANLVNAAQWSRNDKENYSLSNPVYRYLLI